MEKLNQDKETPSGCRAAFAPGQDGNQGCEHALRIHPAATSIGVRSPRAPPLMPHLQRRLNRLRRLALIGLALMLIVVLISAYIRLADGGPGCSPWPRCFGQQQLSAPAEASAHAPSLEALSGSVALARSAHRVIASVALLLVVALAVLCFSDRPFLWREGRLALALLFLALTLAALGLYSSGTRLPAIGVANLVGGLLMFALFARWLAGDRGPLSGDLGAQRSLRVWARAGALVFLAQVVLGGLVSTNYAGGSCTGWLDCVDALNPAVAPWQSFSPLAEARFSSTDLPLHRSAAPLLALHQLFSAVLGGVLLWLARCAWRAGRRRGAVALVALLLLQVEFGLAMSGGALGDPLGLALALAHNLLTALMLALLFSLV